MKLKMAWGEKNGGQGPWGKPKQQGPGKQRPEPPKIDEFIKNFQEKLKRGFQPQHGNKRPVALFLGIALVLYLLSGVYKVDPDEKAVVLRFGQYNRVADSGLNYHLPAPFEAVSKLKVTRINRVEIGFRSGNHGKNGPDIQEESLMLTGDENIVDVNFEVQWVISDIKKYMFNLRNPEETVKSAAESAMREVVGKTPIASALAEGRLEIEQQTQNLLQHILNSYDTGVQLVTVKMLKVDPPTAVIDAFRDVQNARADKERAQNEAESYRNDIIPRARGEASRILQEADGYKQEVIARSEGDSARFLSIYNRYKNAKDVTKRRLYIETMEQILSGMDKIIVDKGVKESGIIPYLPLSEISKAAAKKKEQAQ